jgi:hypothetical protein
MVELSHFLAASVAVEENSVFLKSRPHIFEVGDATAEVGVRLGGRLMDDGPTICAHDDVQLL